jgi:hypothetical protein
MDNEDMKNATMSKDNLRSLQTFENIDADPYSIFTVINTQRDSLIDNKRVQDISTKNRKSDSLMNKK